jgi:hypothetical protein
MIQAFLCYVVNVYSDGLKLYKLLDPLSQQIIQGGIYNDHIRETPFICSSQGKGRKQFQGELELSRDFSWPNKYNIQLNLLDHFILFSCWCAS